MNPRQPLVLIVDDEQNVLALVSRFAEREGCETIMCSGGRDAIAQVQARRVDLVLLDRRMPDVGGLDVLRAIRDIDPRCHIVLMTGEPSVERAIEAVKLGASDYMSKPLNLARLQKLLADIRDDLDRRRSLLTIESDVARRLAFRGMIGRGPAMQELFELIRRLAPHVRTALITGETGTGKELVAHALHGLGPRRDRRFVTVNCAAIDETVIESELFGHVRGAFSGATEHKPGLFELADGGTLFFDEIADLPAGVQGRLLRVIESGDVHRVGSLDPRRVSVQVLAATSRDLRAEVAAGRFRSDLYYRLNAAEVAVPPLRDRREDLPYLTAAFTCESSERLQKPIIGLTPGAERLLAAAKWSGNVRELRSVIERACMLADHDLISEREVKACMPPAEIAVEHAAAEENDQADELLVTVEREHIQRALVRTRGNKKAAARILGLSRRALYRRLERLDLSNTIVRRRESGTEAVGV